MEEADLQRDKSVLAQVQRLDQGVLRPVPEVDGLAIQTCSRTKRDSSAIIVVIIMGICKKEKRKKEKKKRSKRSLHCGSKR